MKADLELSGENFVITRTNDDTADVVFSMTESCGEPVHLSAQEAQLLGRTLILAGTKDPMK